MTVTHERNTEGRERIAPTVRLRTEVLDALMAAKGITSKVAQAREFGVNRSTLFRLRDGETEPQLSLAMTMANRAGTTVEALFELCAGGDNHG